MNGDVFAEKVPFADDEPSRLTFVLYVLRRIANHATGVKAVLCADRGMSCEVDMRTKLAAVADRDVFIDDRVWADTDAVM